jgi:hypothetical protein
MTTAGATEELTDGLGETLEWLRRHQPVEVDRAPSSRMRDLRELERLRLAITNQSMTATVRRMARTGRAPAAVVRCYRVTSGGERALAAWRRQRQGR